MKKDLIIDERLLYSGPFSQETKLPAITTRYQGATRMRTVVAALWAVVAIAAMAVAQEPEATPAMPEMGPSKEMLDQAFMVGTWNYEGDMRWSPADTNWIHHQAEVVFTYVCGGVALRMEYTGEIMGGMMMHGLSHTTYDRETHQWQDTWVDDIAGRQSMYTGYQKDGKRVMEGTDLMNGQLSHTRTTSYDITDSTFNWMMETSIGGQTWWTSMKGSYTKVR
jgi:hypothetical protein